MKSLYSLLLATVLFVLNVECNTPVEGTTQIIGPPCPPEQIINFYELWPFPSDQEIWYSVSEDNTMVTISGEHHDALGLRFDKEIDLAGNNTIELEVVDLGGSIFREDESAPGAGDGKMIKIIIELSSGQDYTLICADETMRSNDPEFILKGIGKFSYSLGNLDNKQIDGFGLVFYNAKLENIKIRAKLICK